jgi:chemotaxis protein CheZ
MPLQDEMADAAAKLEASWKEILANPSLKSEYDQKVEETLAFVALTAKNTSETKALLMDIMMAQDFQDLTGQVIKKITGLAQDLERQLVQVLVDFSPVTKKEAKTTNDSLMNGPQIKPELSENVVSNQEQVDDLLDSLGF